MIIWEEYAVLSSSIVKPPNFERNNGNKPFKGWYVDRECTKPFNALSQSSQRDTELYGRWSDYTVTSIIQSSSSSSEQVHFTVEIAFSAKSILSDVDIEVKIREIIGEEHGAKIEVVRD